MNDTKKKNSQFIWCFELFLVVIVSNKLINADYFGRYYVSFDKKPKVECAPWANVMILNTFLNQNQLKLKKVNKLQTHTNINVYDNNDTHCIYFHFIFFFCFCFLFHSTMKIKAKIGRTRAFWCISWKEKKKVYFFCIW